MIAHDGPLALARPPLPALAFRWRGKWLDLQPAFAAYFRPRQSHTVLLNWARLRALDKRLELTSFDQKTLSIAGQSVDISAYGMEGENVRLSAA